MPPALLPGWRDWSAHRSRWLRCRSYNPGLAAFPAGARGLREPRAGAHGASGLSRPAGLHPRSQDRGGGLLLVFPLCLVPHHLRLEPWVARQEGVMGNDGSRCHAASTLDLLHTLSLVLLSLNSCLAPLLLVYCFYLRSFHRDCCVLSCRLGVGVGVRAYVSSLASSKRLWLLCLLHSYLHPSGIPGGESFLDRDSNSDATTC